MLKDADTRTLRAWAPLAQKADGRNFDEEPIASFMTNENTELRITWTRKHGYRDNARKWHVDFRGWARNPDGRITPIRGYGLSLRIQDVGPIIEALLKAEAEITQDSKGSLAREPFRSP